MTEKVQSVETAQAPPAHSGAPNLWDISFFIFLACVLVGVAWVAVLSHEEGSKNEVTKRNGEAWVQWFKDNSEARMQEDFVLESCAASAMERRRWGDCLQQIMDNVGVLKQLKNPFSLKAPVFVAKCDPKDRDSIGNLLLEKVVPTPAGSAIPSVSSPLVEMDPIDTKISLKLTVCDKGGYAIKVDEFEF
jgi:hypothetical protein